MYVAPSPLRGLQSPPQPAPKQRTKMPARILLVLLLAGLCAGGVHLLSIHTSAAKNLKPFNPYAASNSLSLQTMDKKINAAISSNPKIDVSVSLIDLRSGYSKNYGPDVPYEAASVAKLITAAGYLHQVEQGNESLHATLEDSNSAQQDLRQMVVQSDNNAWQSLNDELGMGNLGTYASSIGITDYDLEANTLRASDIARLLKQLYSGSLLNSSHRQLLLSYMKIANEASYIPPVVPNGVTVYHKAGLLDDRVHDAAIIDNGANPLVLVIFTNGHGSYDFPARTRTIQSIATAALDGFHITSADENE